MTLMIRALGACACNCRFLEDRSVVCSPTPGADHGYWIVTNFSQFCLAQIGCSIILLIEVQIETPSVEA